MKVSELKENDKNPRKIGDSQFQKLADSIKRDPEFMALRPIVYSDDMVVIGGNQRLAAIKSLGIEEIPDAWAVQAENLTEEQAKRFVLIDNGPEGMTGEWDMAALVDDWSIPDLESFGFEIPSFDSNGNTFASALDPEYDDGQADGEKEKNQGNPALGGDIPDDKYQEQYGVIVMCDSEQHQKSVFEDLSQGGHICKVVVV